MSLSQGPWPVESDVTAAQFSEAIRSVFGDGITDYGAQFSMTIGGFTVMLKSGYMLANGRWVWVEDDEDTHLLDIKMPSASKDRVDALVCRVDYANRKASIEMMVDVDEEAVRADPSLVRNSMEYSCILYFINVKRSATSLSSEDVTDVRSDDRLCGYIKPLKDIVEDVLTVYNYFAVTIEEKFADLTEKVGDLISQMDTAISGLESDIKNVGGMVQVGDLMTILCRPHAKDEWVLCKGWEVPPEYPALSELLGGTLPDIDRLNGMFDTYIYAGKPTAVSSKQITVTVADTSYLDYGNLTVADALITQPETTVETDDYMVEVVFHGNDQLSGPLTVTVDGEQAGTAWNTGNRVWTFLRAVDGMSVDVGFSIPVYTVSVNADPSDGGEITGGGSYQWGQAVTLTQTTTDGYRFAGWYNAAGELLCDGETYTFTALENVSITAKYAVIPVYTISVSVDPDGGGTATGGGQYREGTIVTLTSETAEDYRFSGWYSSAGILLESGPVYTFEATEDLDITAKFAAIPYYTVTVSVSPEGGGVATGGKRVMEGESVTVSASPSGGYRLVGWGEGQSEAWLPFGYKALEYIKSSGTQHIDTGFYPTTKTKIVLDLQLPAFSSTVVLYGAREEESGESELQCYVQYISNSRLRVYYFGGVYAYTSSIPGITDRMTVTLDKNVLYAGGESASAPAVEELKVCPYPMFIFGMNNAGKVATRSTFTLYSCKIYDDDVLVRDFIPCADPDGNAGLYDLVDWKFYGNAGSGKFTAGPETDFGAIVSDSPEYTFTPERDTDLTAVFAAVKTYTITATVDPDRYGTVTGDGEYREGETADLSAIPADNKVFVDWKENGATVHNEPDYSFVVDRNRDLTAAFRAKYVAGINWFSSAMSSSTYWSSVAYGNGVFVAVAGGDLDSDKAAYSTDGKKWTAAALPTSSRWKSVTYGNGVFVSVKSGNNVAAYSTDNGKTWTPTSLTASGVNWISVTYGNGTFVAVDSSTSSPAAAYSTDGITWRSAMTPPKKGMFSVAYGNGIFVAVGSGGNAAYTTDGKTWTSTSLPSTADRRTVAYGNGVFVALSEGSTAAYSTDGEAWGLADMPSSQGWPSVTYGDGIFAAVSGSYSNSDAAAYSADGKTWEPATLPASARWKGVAYGNGVFVAVAGGTTATSKAAYSYSE